MCGGGGGGGVVWLLLLLVLCAGRWRTCRCVRRRGAVEVGWGGHSFRASAILLGLSPFYDWRHAGECVAGSLAPTQINPPKPCVQNDLPALTEFDKHAMAALCSEFEVDFMTLSYARSQEDVFEAREFLQSIGREGIKVRLMGWLLRGHGGPCWCCMRAEAREFLESIGREGHQGGWVLGVWGGGRGLQGGVLLVLMCVEAHECLESIGREGIKVCGWGAFRVDVCWGAPTFWS